MDWIHCDLQNPKTSSVEVWAPAQNKGLASLSAADPLEITKRNFSQSATGSLGDPQLLILLLLGLRGCGGVMGKGCPRAKSCWSSSDRSSQGQISWGVVKQKGNQGKTFMIPLSEVLLHYSRCRQSSVSVHSPCCGLGLRDRLPLIFRQQLVTFSFPFQTCRINSVLLLPAAAVQEHLSNHVHTGMLGPCQKCGQASFHQELRVVGEHKDQMDRLGLTIPPKHHDGSWNEGNGSPQGLFWTLHPCMPQTTSGFSHSLGCHNT